MPTCLLTIIISIQFGGIIVILTLWQIKRSKRQSYSRPWPEEKFLQSYTTSISSQTISDIPLKMKSLNQQGEDKKAMILQIGQHGFIRGVNIQEQGQQATDNPSSDATTATKLVIARYFGGVRYALPPSQRWGMAQSLPPDYSYGTELEPGACDGRAVTSPQPFAGDEGASEDCFQCNVWTPVGERPAGGWPVIFYIHGGYLQTGSPNEINPARLLSETNLKCVIVAPVYRLAVLGFLNSAEIIKDAGVRGELSGNQGFWDQRIALEWTKKHARYFGGNEENITAMGYSAGSYSVFHQLAHDLYLSREKSIIRQAVMFSNGPGVQPKSESEVQKQFNALLTALNIPLSISPSEKLAQLRSVPARELINASIQTQYHQYRPWHDGHFIAATLFRDIDNGSFARRMIERNVRLINGECRDEHFVYGTWFTPDNSCNSLRQRLEADYPQQVCNTLVKLYYPTGQLPANCRNWQDAFGRIYADMQVHMLERGLVNALARGGAGHLVYRYRIEYRVKCVTLPPEWGVTHSSDLAMWLWGNGARLEENEKRIVSEALIEPLAGFVNGAADMAARWGTARGMLQQVRRLRSDGQVDIWHDEGEMWQKGLTVWNALQQVRCAAGDAAKL